MTDAGEPRIREARPDDLAAIVALLADDPLGNAREHPEDPLPDAYRTAYEEIRDSRNEHLLVAEAADRVVGCLQLSLLPSLTFGGRRRAQIEGVRIHRDHRGQGVGRLMIAAAKQMARQAGCHIIQLTTNRQRPEARRFYEKQGFVDSHHGLKLYLQD